MPKCYLLWGLVALLAGCANNDIDKETLEELRSIKQEVASLSDSIATLKDSLKSIQTQPVIIDTIAVDVPKQTPATKPATTVETKPAPPKPTTKPKAKDENTETTYHKYVNGKVSVKITPWVNGERKVLLYDLQGNETYAMEEVRHSYSISVDLKFAPNGSVSMAVVHTNPGASMYWYETEIKFDTDNTPLSKIDHKYPQNNLEEMMNEKWMYWDKKSKTWKQQETAE